MSLITRYTIAAGMTTSLWMSMRAQLVPVAACTPTQGVDDDLWLQRHPMPQACADPCIHLVQLGGVLWVEDGHYRLARARRDHQSSIPARVLVCA